jgi:nicotinate phosphoribosyltransferase
VNRFRFDSESLDYLSYITGPTGIHVFSQEFLTFLSKARIDLDIYGVEDGEVVFPYEPILRVQGPIYLCQLMETPLLNIINFQSLIATKAARMIEAANGKAVIDFGLRRAQGFDGAISATKAAYIGGIMATSNMWAAKNFKITPSGTQAHSFVMSYENQKEAFLDSIETFPHNCILIVDTYDPIEGIRDAVKIFSSLKNTPRMPLGIRLDSGDLLYLSLMARNLFDRACLSECKIIASGDLDEYEISRLEKAFAPIDVYGAGTKLITAYDDPALSGVYKLASVYENGRWRDTFKESATKSKESWPGPQAIIRAIHNNIFAFDHIIDSSIGHTEERVSKKPFDYKIELHSLLMKQGTIIAPSKRLEEIRLKAASSVKSLPDEVRGITKASIPYPVYIDDALVKKRSSFINTSVHESYDEGSTAH